MDRPIIYPSQIPFETDLLSTNQNAMVALGMLAQAVLGSSTVLDGLACTPTTPASLSVKVGAGSLYALANLEATAYSSLLADTTHQIVKQGIVLDSTTFGCPAPPTSGQSVVYLVQAQYQDEDTGSEVLEYYNADDPTHPYSGPANAGTSNFTIRKGLCALGLKTGVAATTGSQATPSPDAGYTGLFAITVANGQTTITSGNIQQLSTAPFISAKLPAMLSTIQSGAVSYAPDTSGAANTITIALNPAPAALVAGMRANVKVANSVTGATVMNTNGLGNVAVKTTSGADLTANAMQASGVYTLIHDGNHWQLQGFAAASATGLIPTNNLSDVSSASTSLKNLLPSQSGNAGKNLQSNGTSTSWKTTTQNYQDFISSGTFTTPADINADTTFKFTVTGAGGGGGGGSALGTAGGGGGAGASAIYMASGLSPSTGYSIMIGTGGAGSSSGTGSSGGASSVVIGATTVTANGGTGGAGNATSCLGGSGGTASNGTRNIPGGDGASAANPQSGNLGGHGGTSLWGGGGKGAIAGTGSNGEAPGSGGGGGANTSAVGGNGADGIVTVEWVH